MIKRNNLPYKPCKYCGTPVRKRIVIEREKTTEYLIEKFPPFGWRKHKCPKKKLTSKKK